MSLIELQLAIEPHLKQIERLLPPEYRLTLVCRHTKEDGPESDILLSRDDLPLVRKSIEYLEQRDGVEVPVVPPESGFQRAGKRSNRKFWHEAK